MDNIGLSIFLTFNRFNNIAPLIIHNSKFVKNGQLIIRKENKTFNVLGAELK